jgi:ABC-2 type transport system ATP-binding protein
MVPVMAPDPDPAISVEGLTRTFRAPVRQPGLKAAFRSILRREYKIIDAVCDLSFQIGSGELVGLIGPNGAGKTTTMKMLAGVLQPSAGELSVLGYTPGRRERDFLRSIALLRGSQPIGGPAELTVMDNFHYRRLLYDIPRAQFDDHLAELAEILDLDELLGRQVRALSLGQRMRAGLALCLIHRPRVVFLDEPTIGLDATAALAFRGFVGRYATGTGATIILTSHYMTEVEALCSRVILIDKGTLRFDGSLRALASSLSPWKEIRVTPLPGRTSVRWEDFGDVVTEAADSVSIRIRRDLVPQITADLLARTELTDLSVVEPPLEVVLDQYYRTEQAS